MSLSMVEVVGLAYDAGLRNPAKLAQAAAIASAESGRNPTRLGDTGRVGERTADGRHWGTSIGLWQIRSIQEEKGKGSTRDQDKLTDPAANARAMAEVSKNGATWSPWSVTSALDPAGYLRYQAALPLAVQAVGPALAAKGAQAGAEKATDAAGAVLDPVLQLAATVAEVAQTPVRVANWLTESGTWVRIAFLLSGGALLILGVAKVVQGPMTARAAQVVQTVLPAGKVGKLMGKAG